MKKMFTMLYISRIWIFSLGILLFAGDSWSYQQQYFRTVPINTRAREGSETVLVCEVSNLAGQVQWAKDGFALGFSSIIPGHPRYTMLVDQRRGVYNLRVVNASLDDDAEFQCQVGPAPMHRGIRANASLTVIAPPTAVEIAGHAAGAKLEVREGNAVTLECRAREAKPAASVVWYRGQVQLKPDRTENEIIEVEDPSGNPKRMRYTTISRIHLKPTSEDDQSEITCEARHEALQHHAMRSSVQLSVLYPPGAPYIEGYTRGEPVRRGDSVELVCRSRGGNPPAQLVWYRNGEQIGMAYRTTGRMSENVLTFTPTAADHKARYRCEARNIMISNTLKAEVDLTVHYAPSEVTVSGPSEARIGDRVSLSCATAASNPPAVVKWLVMRTPAKADADKTVMAPEGGWVTISNISFAVPSNERTVVVICSASSSSHQLTENVISTHTINVLYPPSTPVITGYTPGTILAAGTNQKLLCISHGGNPLATLTWYKNDKKVNSTTRLSDKTDSVSAELSIVTSVTDNQAQYRCEAINTATDIPLFESVTLSVHFPPEAVKVRVEPAAVRPGELATLVCDAASSNPPAALSWWRDGIPVSAGTPTVSKPGLHWGTVSTIELKLNVTKEMNGAIYTCQAMNEALQRSVVNSSQALNVLYAPSFIEPPREKSATENETLAIQLRVDGNPSSFSYTWTKDGHPVPGNTDERVLAEGGTLNFTRVTRDDAGIYTCEAINSQGAATVNITVHVNYAPIIESVSPANIVEAGDEAVLYCTAKGNPLTEDHFAWSREGYEKFSSKTTTTFDPRNGTSYLHVSSAGRSDVGKFKCVVNNGVGKPATKDVMLIAKFAPEMENAPNKVKFATRKGEIGRITCSCQAAPPPTFDWYKNGAKLPVNASSKYYSNRSLTDDIVHTSVLHVASVNSNDYGQYECVARNDKGEGRVNLLLNFTSVPDMVLSLRVTNITHDSISVEWVPGFDGGLPARYKIRSRAIYDSSQLYREDGPYDSTAATVRGLQPATEYVVSVGAANRLGAGPYRPDETRITTLALTTPGELSDPPTRVEEKVKDSQVMVYVSVLAAALLLINVALVGCFLWRRRSRLLKEQAGQSSKSATIEMYAPSSYNETMSGETLSSVSDKSESYSNEEREPPPIPQVPVMPSRHAMQNDGYMLEPTDTVLPPPALDYPPPNYAPYDSDAHARTLPHPHKHRAIGSVNSNTLKPGYAPSPSPMPPLDGSYYSMSTDRYLSYPPMEYMQHAQVPPPQQYSSPSHKMAPLSHNSPPPNYLHQHNNVAMDRQSLAGTLRRQRDKMAAVPPPDVTVLHATCTQIHNRSPPTQTEKQPQSILKDPSRQKYQNYGSPVSNSTPNTSNQILTVQNLTSDVPQYGTIRKDKKNNVTIDDSFKRETHVV